MASTYTVQVIPDASGWVARLESQLDPVTRRIAENIKRELQRAVRDGLNGSGLNTRVQGTRAGQQFGDAFSRTAKSRIEAALRSLPDVQIGVATTAAEQHLRDLSARLKTLGEDIELGVDDKKAITEIEALKRELSRLARNSTDVRVRVNTGTALAELEALKRSLDGFDRKGKLGRIFDDLRDKSRIVDMIATKLSGLGDVLSALPLGKIGLVAAIIAALSTIGPIAAAASAALIGLAGVAGVAGLAVLGLKEQMAKQTGFGQKISEEFKGITSAAKGLGQVAANAIGPALVDVLAKVKSLLPGFEGLVKIVGGRLGGAFRSVGDAVLSIFQKAGPLIVDVAGYIEQGAAAFSRWVAGDGFSKFLAYARQQLPILIGYAKDFGSAIIDTFVALAPTGEAVLKILDYIAKGLSAASKIIAPGGASILGNLLGNDDDKKKVDANADYIDQLLKDYTRFQTGAGRIAEAAAPLDGYTKIIGDLVPALSAASGNGGQFAASVSGIDERIRAATPALQTFMDTAGSYDAATAKAADTVKLLGDALNASRGNALDYATAMVGADTATQGIAKTLHDNAASIAKDGTLLGVSHLDAAGKFVDASNKFSEGSSAIVQGFQAQVAAATTAATATYQNELATKGQATAANDALTVYKGYRQSLIDSAVAAGTARDKAEALADQYFAIPPDVDTFVKLLGQDNVALAIQGLTDALNRLSDFIGAPTVTLNSTAFDNALKIKNSDLDYFGGRKPIPSLDLSTGAFNGKAAAANGALDVLDRRNVGPTVNLNDNASYKLRGITGLLLGLHDKTIYVNTVTGGQAKLPNSAQGNIFDSVPHFARGTERHMPQIAKATTPYRIWAEPETGGEAYIPLANDSRRSRAEDILGNVAGRFGFDIMPKAMSAAMGAVRGSGSGSGLLGVAVTIDAGSVGTLTGHITNVADGRIAQTASDQQLAGSAGPSGRLS